jgi:sugar phosphate permease
VISQTRPLEKDIRQRQKRAALIFVLLSFAYLLVYFHRLCPAVVALELMKTFKTGGALLGFLGSAYFYPYALMQLPAGLLADSWGPRKSMTLFLTLGAAGSFLFGLAPNVGTALVGRTLVGIGVSLVFIPAMKLLALWFQPRQFVYYTGLLMAMGGIGSLSAAAPLAWLSQTLGWRSSFVLIGLITLFLILMIWRVVRDRPEDLGYSPVLDLSLAAPVSREKIGLSDGMKLVLSTGPFWPLAIWFFLTCGIFFSFIGLWGGPYLMEVYHLDKQSASYILSMAAVGMILGGPLLSFLSDRIVKGRKPVLIGSSLMMVMTSVPLSFFTGSLNPLLLYVICLNIGIFSGAIVTIAFTATKELFPTAIAGTSTGTVNLFPFFGGAVFQPFMGLLLERAGKDGGSFTLAGYQSAFQIYFFSALAAFFVILGMKETFSSR